MSRLDITAVFVLLTYLQCALCDGAEYERKYRETVHRAQCQAHCLTKFGALDLPPEYRVMNTYKAYSCLDDDYDCQQCMAACNHQVTSSRECRKTCGLIDGLINSGACKTSCSFLFRLFNSETISKDESVTASDVVVTTPKAQCKGVSLVDSRDLPAYMYVKWEVLNFTKPADIPLMFVLSTYDIVLGKTRSNLVPVNELELGGSYKLLVTAVSAHGVIHESVVSNSLTMYNEWKSAQPPTNFHTDSLTVNTTSAEVSAVVQWTANPHSMNCYYSLYWMSTSTGDNGFRKLHAPLQDWKFQIGALGFSQNYTVHIFSYDINTRPEYESDAAITWFVTPDCLSAMSYDLSVCAPLRPRDLSVTNMTRHNGSVAVSLVWTDLLNFTTQSDDTNSYNFSIEFVRLPTLMFVSDDQIPHRGEVIVDGLSTRLTLTDLYSESLYKFYVKAISEGGESDVSVAEIHTGEPQPNLARAAQSTEEHIPAAAKKHNAAYISVIITVLVAVGAALTVFAVYRTKVRKRAHKKMPFNLTMTELNYMMDTSMADLEMNVKLLDFGKEIGSGAFGRVVKATVKDNSNLPPGLHKNMIVAVKMLKEFASSEDEANFVKEMRLMKHVGRHPCIVSMLACCTKPPGVCIIMDYCDKGDLKSYLRDIREEMLSHDRQIEMSPECKQSETQALLSGTAAITRDDLMYADLGYAGTSYTDDSSDSHSAAGSAVKGVSAEERNKHMIAMFLSFARQIAFGMEYLAQKKFVHRDLAARNVLVCGEGVVKIADFGLTRDIYENSVYQKSGGGKLPVKWMALESIFDQTYTTQSDVWSFGIVLWEIVTLGGSPYPGIANSELLNLLKQGHRMEKPANCSQEIYDVMVSCWHPIPTKRPTFTELVALIDSMLESGSNYMDLHVNSTSECYLNQKGQQENSQEECEAVAKRCLAERRTSTPFKKSTFLVTSTHCQSLDMLSQTKLRNDDRNEAYTDTPCKKVYAQRSFSESDIPDFDNTQLSVEIVV